MGVGAYCNLSPPNFAPGGGEVLTDRNGRGRQDIWNRTPGRELEFQVVTIKNSLYYQPRVIHWCQSRYFLPTPDRYNIHYHMQYTLYTIN